MKQFTISKLIDYTSILGIIIWFSAFFLDNWIRDWFFPSSWGSTATMLILPALGTFILIVSIYYKKLWTGLLGIFFIISFPLTFGLAYLILGP